MSSAGDQRGRLSGAAGRGGRAPSAPAGAPASGSPVGEVAASPAAAAAPDPLLDVLAPRRGLRRAVAGAVLLEGLALVIAAVFLAGGLIFSTPTDVAGEITQALITLVIGAGLLQLGRVVLRADERARIPVLVWQALQASVGVPALSTKPLFGIALLLPAAVAVAGVLVPGVLRPDVRGLARDE